MEDSVPFFDHLLLIGLNPQENKTSLSNETPSLENLKVLSIIPPFRLLEKNSFKI